MATSHPPFGSRSAYAGAGAKLPERANPVPFSASAFSRNRGLGAANNMNINNNTDSAQPPPPVPSTHSHAQGHAAGTMIASDPSGAANPLSRLTEEQREEINEAVRKYLFSLFPWPVYLQEEERTWGETKGERTIYNLRSFFPTSSHSSTLTAIAI